MVNRLDIMREAISVHCAARGIVMDANWQMLDDYIVRACTMISDSGVISYGMPDGNVVQSYGDSSARIITTA